MKKITFLALALMLTAMPILASENSADQEGAGGKTIEVVNMKDYARKGPGSSLASSTKASLSVLKKVLNDKLAGLRKAFVAATKKAEAEKKAGLTAIKNNKLASSTELISNRKDDFKKAEEDFKKNKQLRKKASSTVATTLKELNKKRNEDYRKSQTEYVEARKEVEKQAQIARQAVIDKFQADMKAAKAAFVTASKAAKAEYEAARKALLGL